MPRIVESIVESAYRKIRQPLGFRDLLDPVHVFSVYKKRHAAANGKFSRSRAYLGIHALALEGAVHRGRVCMILK